MNIGDRAPEVLGKDEQGREIRLSDYQGRKLVLYFYPKDNTSGCTSEAIDEHWDELNRLINDVFAGKKIKIKRIK